MTDTTEPPFLPFARPSITELERAAVDDVLRSGWLTTGPRVQEFEAAFAAYVGVPHAVAVNSATAALHLALNALDIGPGDDVLVPTWTFAASAEVVIYQGARPVLVDVDPDSLNVTVGGILAAITPRTKAAIVVHIAGRPAPIEELVAELSARGIAVVEDAAHAFPSRLPGATRLVGTYGRANAYSFYATKTITTGEGGMLVTDDPAIADRVRMMALHGISRDAWKRYTEAGSWYYEIEAPGFKYNMTDIAAALGLAQLSRAQELLQARRELAQAYTQSISASSIASLVELPRDEANGSHAWHLYILRLHLDRLTVDRAEVIRLLRESRIGASVHFIPLHLHPYYRSRPETTPYPLPVATAEYERVVSLPIWPGMTMADVERVTSALERSLSAGRR
jgi:dTDP-4-amino-4,6-dideoxygalactose transaminase